MQPQLFAFLLSAVALGAFADNSLHAENFPASRNVEALTNANYSIRSQAARVIANESIALEMQLLAIASTPSATNVLNSPQKVAFDLLGELRSEEAVDTLITNITRRFRYIRTEATDLSAYPCVQALIKIGIPSVRGIFSRLNRPATEEELKLFTYVVRCVDGDTVGRYRIEVERDVASGLRKKGADRMLQIFLAGQDKF